MKVKNWADFQHYRDGRSLHWIKLYRTLLDNYDFAALSGDDAKVLILCWLVAAEKDGELPDTPALAFRLPGERTRHTAPTGRPRACPACRIHQRAR